MIKVYCNKCGKEITENVNREVEETKAFDLYGTAVSKWTDVFHYCDKCQYENLTCGFKVGDMVFTDDGRVGVIESFCNCKTCKKRGFYEPNIKMEIGNGQIYITDTDKKNGFISFYQIGDQVFGNIDEESVLNDIQYKKDEIRRYQEELIELEGQLNMVKVLQRGKSSVGEVKEFEKFYKSEKIM